MTKKLIKTIWVFAFAFSNILAFAQFGGGDGLSEATAYQISTVKHLEELSDSVNIDSYPNWSYGKYFKVMNDITDGLTRPIGYAYGYVNHQLFQGYFDGQGYRISLAIDSNMIFLNAGLFAGLMSGTVIKNVVVDGYVKAAHLAGGIAGGFAMPDPAIITNCINMANITSNIAGGIVGGVIIAATMNVTIENCINVGTIQGSSIAGGIVGFTILSTITNCINNGFIRGNLAGGIAGGIGGNTTISKCFNSGVVSGNSSVGCIVGLNNGAAL